MAKRKVNIVMFPFMAQGHIMPFLALALKLQKKKQNYTINFINTPLNIKQIRSSASLPLNSNINFLEIPFTSSDHDLPPNTENAYLLSIHQWIHLIQVSSCLKPSFKTLISNLVNNQQNDPLCIIIADMFFGWTAEIAHEFGAFHVIFNAGGGYGMAVYHTLYLNLPHKTKTADRDSDDELLKLPDFPESSRILHVKHLTEELKLAEIGSSSTVFHKKMFDEWLGTDGFLFNTMEEFDHIGLNYFRRKIGRPVWPIGPILLSVEGEAKKGGDSWELYNEWLDKKPLNSVLYVSFGSQYTISRSQMMELAMALEGSRKSFIWVIRAPLGFDIGSDFETEEWLPKGFVRRMREGNVGLLVKNWAPQLKILCHKSICAFLSHCGWNSVVEGVCSGVPIMAWPIGAEQTFNAKMLEEEIGVCVEVASGFSSEVRHEEIVKRIELVMGETEKGKDLRRKASEVRDMSKKAMEDGDGFKGCSTKAMDDFLRTATATAMLMHERRNKFLIQSNPILS